MLKRKLAPCGRFAADIRSAAQAPSQGVTFPVSYSIHSDSTLRWYHQTVRHCGPGYKGGQHMAHVRKVGRADAIVTFNIKDFQASVLRP